VAGSTYETLNLQKTLNRLKVTDSNGNALEEDGSYGPLTKSAVRKFQSIAGIDVDGSAGPQTRGALNSILAKPVLKQGARGIPVRYLQFRVGADIDGHFGPKTKAAVMTYQKNNGLEVDASVGPKTWAKLIG
jgi:N-acetylmuramoyl-L-alanine amidase